MRSELKGTEYEPIFPYFADKKAEGAFKVLNDDYVTTDDGVGLVHIAPAYPLALVDVEIQAGLEALGKVRRSAALEGVDRIQQVYGHVDGTGVGVGTEVL